MDQAHVEISENSIYIHQLQVPVKEVADFFRSIPQAEHDFTLMKAIEVGVFCLERGRTAQDTDFVKRKMAELLSQVEQAVVDIPARTEKSLLRQIGADDGQVLNPVKKLVNEASSETARRINDLKALLSEDLDPKSSTRTFWIDSVSQSFAVSALLEITEDVGGYVHSIDFTFGGRQLWPGDA